MRLNTPSIIVTSKGGQSPLQTSIVRKHNPSTIMILLTPSVFLISLTALASTTLAIALAVTPVSDLSPIHHPVNLTSTTPPDTDLVPSFSSSTPLSPLNSQAHCQTSKIPFTRSRPRFTDCGSAIRQLPSNHIIGTFHTAGADTIFRLPVEETSGSCTVRVEMMTRTGDEDVSTWLAIGAAATQLNIACVHGFAFPLKMGGWTAAGRDERIGVVLRSAVTRE